MLGDIIRNQEPTVIDVREDFEFKSGHYSKAINIPLGLIQTNINNIKGMKKPIVVYCRSGNRSGMAQQILQSNGINEVYNGGGIGDMKIYDL
ncbi:MAG: hypothetical protein RIR51_1163 [Bacteroidota bacterium]|jgi:phage shock protein E